MKVKALSLVVNILIASSSFTGIKSNDLFKSLFGNALNFDSTYVLDDLYSSSNFNIQDYNIDLEGLKKHPQIINFTEYCFDKDMNLSNYSLYFYLYNPQLINFNYESSLNKIQFSIGEHEYYKYAIELLSKSDDERFLKFKVKLNDSELKRISNELNVNERIYNISSIELLRNVNNNAYDYFASDSDKQIGGSYIYTGFSKGYGSNESTLNCEVKELECIKLDVKDLYKRYDDAKISFKKTQVNSVYFSVPEYYFENYGNLKSIDFEYYKFRTSPIFVLKSDTYNVFKDYVGKKWSASNPGYYIYGQYSSNVSSVVFPFNLYGENFNNLSFTDLVFPELDNITWLFDGGSDGTNVISSDKLKAYMGLYNKSFVNGKNYKGYSNDLFDLNSFSNNYNKVSISDKDVVNILKADNSFWGKWFHINEELTYKSLEEIDYSSLEANSLIIDESLFESFEKDCNQNKKNNERTYILRFDNTPYYSTFVYDKKVGDIAVEGVDGYVCQQYVYLDFDIINLTFSKDGIYKNIPAVSNPNDIITETQPPSNNPDWLKELLVKLWKIIQVILLILSIIGIVWLIFKSFDLLASMKILFGGKKTKKKNKKK